MTRTLVASDWHLGTFSPPAHAALAEAFLDRAREAGDAVILNGDVFEGIFEPADRAEAAQPAVAARIAALGRDGRLRRTEGNHDPGSGEADVVIDHATLGRLLVMHGHQVDPVHDSAMGRFGDGISRRYGRLGLVRGLARAVEVSVAALAARRVDALHRERCAALADRRGCALAIVGHTHRRHLAAGDRVVNTGCLTDTRLEYLVIDDGGLRLETLTGDGAAGANPTGDAAAGTDLTGDAAAGTAPATDPAR
ncbi:MAG: metallophosphoesterase family protein [Vicinamibacterales bacterium]